MEMIEKVRGYLIAKKYLGFLPSLHNLTTEEERRLKDLIFELSEDKKFIEFLTLYNMATQINLEGKGLDASSYELGGRDCIMNLRNLLTTDFKGGR